MKLLIIKYIRIPSLYLRCDGQNSKVVIRDPAGGAMGGAGTQGCGEDRAILLCSPMRLMMRGVCLVFKILCLVSVETI